MSIHIDKGDYLVFAAIGTALGIPGIPIKKCEVSSGIWRRHWDLKENESRSDISRDGVLGVLLYSVIKKDKGILDRLIKAGWKNWWTMGERGNFDYVNMFPLVPLIYALRYSKWIPTIPPFAIKSMLTGFRAHLLALNIMIEMENGKRGWLHRHSLKRLIDANPNNPWFHALYNKQHGYSQTNVHTMMQTFDNSESAYGWGSCPGEVFKKLVERSLT